MEGNFAKNDLREYYFLETGAKVYNFRKKMGCNMRYFVVEIIYTAPSKEVEAVRPMHREFLQSGYDTGKLLVSGPKPTGDGGIVIAKDESEDYVKNFFLNDPYNLQGLAEYRFIEFKPMSHQYFLKDWLS